MMCPINLPRILPMPCPLCPDEHSPLALAGCVQAMRCPAFCLSGPQQHHRQIDLVR